MFKILIADDEGIVIDALTFIIQKNFQGQCQIESAKTGRSVIELAESYRPDIIFMDIQMPGINGIEAMKEIRKNSRETLFIVLSAYDKFDYAKEAVGLGVMEYVTKPIDQDVITALLAKAMSRVDAARNKRKNDLLVKEKLETVVPIIESGLIYSILFQENFSAETDNFKTLLGIEEEYGYIIAIEWGDSQEEGHLTNVIGASVRIHTSYTWIRETVKEYFNGIVGPIMANLVMVYVPCSKEVMEYEYEERVQIINQARKMLRKLKNSLDAQFRIGIGSVKELNQAGFSYTEAMNALQFSGESIVHTRDLPIKSLYEEDYPIHTERKLLECVQSGNVEGAAFHGKQIADWLIGSCQHQLMDIKLKVLEFVLNAEMICFESGGSMYSMEDRRGYLQTIFELKTQEEVSTWFLVKIREAVMKVQKGREENSVSLVKRARDYIKNNYFREISLDDVSREVNISPYYFSKLFKEETGENFIEFLTGIRMEKARDLLVNTDKSMKEICSEIGYSDPNYFSRTFKKNMGVTPTEFKEGKG